MFPFCTEEARFFLAKNYEFGFKGKTINMKLLELRKQIKNEFNALGIETEDTDFIVAEVLGVKRTDLVLIDEISSEQEKEVVEKCELRKNNIPVDKIFNKAYFYGLEFKVNNNVLSPRPESEMLVENALKYIHKNDYKSVLDLCTGSGCLAISIKKNANVKLTASDISTKALSVAKENAKNLGAEINFVHSNMFEKIENSFDLIVTNPPYIDSDEVKQLDDEVKNNDPHLALDGGELGLKYYNIIHDNLRKHLNDNGMIIMEIGEDQKELLISLFNDFNLVECLVDLSGNDRVLIFRK